MRRLLLALLLLCAPAFAAEPKVVVNGQHTAVVGSMFFLDVSDSVSDTPLVVGVAEAKEGVKPAVKVIKDEGVATIVRVLPTSAGRYELVFAATGKVDEKSEAVTVYRVWAITVTDTAPTPPPTPTPGPTPPPEPDPSTIDAALRKCAADYFGGYPRLYGDVTALLAAASPNYNEVTQSILDRRKVAGTVIGQRIDELVRPLYDPATLAFKDRAEAQRVYRLIEASMLAGLRDAATSK